MPASFPIVYVRGYAMSSSDVEATFNLPYYGFNQGATQYRQGAGRDPEMHIFESPVMRLIKDHGYLDAFNRFTDVEGNPSPDSVPANRDWRRTLWIFRYYDREATLFDEDRPPFSQYAVRLLAFLNEVRLACGDPEGFAVNLVAHSMGGLIARSYLQNPEFFADYVTAGDEGGERAELREPVRVNKLFTYGTPHRGIRFRGALGPVNLIRELTGGWREDQFTARYMRRYLGLEEDAQPHVYEPQPYAPPLTDTFSLVGTNASDYVVRGSRAAVGVKSDGLVLTENAYIRGGPRAYVYKAHSGPFGLVNSEEGYQNLQRFLFGNLRYQLRLGFGAVSGRLPDTDRRDELRRVIVELAIAIRGVSGYLDHRAEAELTAEEIDLTQSGEEMVPLGEAAPVLHTGHLFAFQNNRRLYRTARERYSRWVLDLVIKPQYRRAGLLRSSRFEGDHFLDDRLELAIGDDGAERRLRYRWQNHHRVMQTPEAVTAPTGVDHRFAMVLPPAARRYLRDVRLLIDVADLREASEKAGGAGDRGG